MKIFTRMLPTIFALLMPVIALAQEVPSGTPAAGGTSLSGGAAGTTACQAIITSASVNQANGVLSSLGVFLAGTPFRVAAIIGFVVAGIVLLLDSGHMPHIVQRVLQVLMIMVMAGILVGYVSNGASLLSC